MGLGARAAGVNLSPQAVSEALAAPAAAVQVAGSAGGFAILFLVFLAVTSATSAEMVAVSSIMSFDIYRTYILKEETLNVEQVEYANRVSIVIYVLFMGTLSCILRVTGIYLGYLYLLMGVLISPCVLPLSLSIMWKETNRTAAFVAPIVGLVCGISAWLVGTAVMNDNVISIETSGEPLSMLCGNVTSIAVGGIITIVWSLLRPANYNFNLMRQKFAPHTIPTEEEHAQLKKQFRFSAIAAGSLVIVFLLLIPLPLFFSRYIFSPEFFTGWVSIGIAWVFMSSFAVVVFPLFEGRRGLKRNCGGLFRDCMRCSWGPKEDPAPIDELYPAQTLSGKQLHTADHEEVIADHNDEDKMQGIELQETPKPKEGSAVDDFD